MAYAPHENAPTLTLTQAARIIGLSRQRVGQLVNAGKIPVVVHGKRQRIRVEDAMRMRVERPARPESA